MAKPVDNFDVVNGEKGKAAENNVEDVIDLHQQSNRSVMCLYMKPFPQTTEFLDDRYDKKPLYDWMP